jgi:transposase
MFLAYLKRCPVPTLKAATSSSCTICRSTRPRRARVIEAEGVTLLYIPPYSLGFDPIEQASSRLKVHLSKAAETTVPRRSGCMSQPT